MRFLRLTSFLVGPKLRLRRALGSNLLFWWEAELGLVTLAGSLVSVVNDTGPNSWHATQAVGGNQPTWVASGGSNGKSYISMARTGDRVLKTGLSIASGTRPGLYCLARNSATTSRFFAISRVAAAGNMISLMGRGSVAAQWQLRATFPVAGQLTVFPITPTLDTNWHLHSQVYRSTGCDYRIDNTAITAPGFTATTEAAAAIERFSIGRDDGSSGGDVHFLLGTVAPPTARQDAEIRLYSKRLYGI